MKTECLLYISFYSFLPHFLLQCESDSFGEDIEGTETEESSEYDTEDEYADDFIDDSDIDMYPSSTPNSGGILTILLIFLEVIR